MTKYRDLLQNEEFIKYLCDLRSAISLPLEEISSSFLLYSFNELAPTEEELLARMGPAIFIAFQTQQELIRIKTLLQTEQDFEDGMGQLEDVIKSLNPKAFIMGMIGQHF
jgi:hypothetical protein